MPEKIRDFLETGPWSRYDPATGNFKNNVQLLLSGLLQSVINYSNERLAAEGADVTLWNF